MLAVSDTGTGMDAATQARAFEPFYTTKGWERDGPGPFIVYGIVKQNGGGIVLSSEPSRGTVFEIYIPAAEAPVPAAPAEADDRDAEPSNATIS